MIVKSSGSVTVYVSVTSHPLSSATTTVYSPATNPVRFGLVSCPVGIIPFVVVHV